MNLKSAVSARNARLRLLWLLSAALGSISCAYSPPAPVLPPPEMVIEDRPATDAAAGKRPLGQEWRPERIGEHPPPQQPSSGDELARIEDLQRRGVITAQEAQVLKRQLQARQQPAAGPGEGAR